MIPLKNVCDSPKSPSTNIRLRMFSRKIATLSVYLFIVMILFTRGNMWRAQKKASSTTFYLEYREHILPFQNLLVSGFRVSVCVRVCVKCDDGMAMMFKICWGSSMPKGLRCRF